MAEHDDLLARFQPAVRYDSNEQFFADSAAQYMVNPGNELRRRRTDDAQGAVLASAQPEGDEPQLTLAFLGEESYADASPVQEGDLIGVRGRDYREQYRRLRIARPDIAVYAQHRFGEMRRWADIEKLAAEPDRPVIYVARGSHASYFEAGFHQTEAWYDLADGRREAPKLRLEILGTDEPPWTRWPGRWGDTLPRQKDLESDSPTGPGAKKQWTAPDKLLSPRPHALSSPSTPPTRRACRRRRSTIPCTRPAWARSRRTSCSTRSSATTSTRARSPATRRFPRGPHAP